MVDDVNILNISPNVIAAVGWAKDTTLQRLLDVAGDQKLLLESIAKIKAQDLKNVKAAGDGLKGIAQAAEDATAELGNIGKTADRVGKAVKTYEDHLKELSEAEDRKARDKWTREYRDSQNLKRSVGDLRTSLSRLERASPIGMFGELTDKIAVAGGRLTDMGGKSAMAGWALTQFSRALTVASFGVGALVAGLDPFRQLFDAGISFGGSIEQMQIDVNKTGVGLQDFTRIALQYGNTISGMGGEHFSKLVRQVQDGTRSFGRYGQSVTAQTESVAAYMEMLGSGGLRYKLNLKEQTEATQKYLREQTALTLLTGKSRKQLEEEQKRVAAREEVALAIRELKATGRVDEAQRLEELQRVVTGVMGESAGIAAVQEAMGRTTTEKGFLNLLSVSGQQQAFAQMAQQYRAGALSPADLLGSMQQMGAGFNRPELLSTFGRAAGTTGAGGTIAKELNVMTTRLDKVLELDPKEREKYIKILLGTESGLDKTTLAMEQISGDFARITGDLKATFFTVAQKLGIFSTGAPLAAGATGMGAQASTDLLDFAGGGVMQSLGILGLYMGGSMLKGMLARRGIGAAAGALRTPALPQMAGPPPPPALPAAARAAPGLMTLAPRVGGLAMAGGLAGGALLGAGGAYQAAYGQDRASRMMGIGTSALSGAMMGAMFGLPGMLIGGALGAGAGALANYYGAGGAAAAEPDAALLSGSDVLSLLTALNTSITLGLGPQGAIVAELRNLTSLQRPMATPPAIAPDFRAGLQPVRGQMQPPVDQIDQMIQMFGPEVARALAGRPQESIDRFISASATLEQVLQTQPRGFATPSAMEQFMGAVRDIRPGLQAGLQAPPIEMSTPPGLQNLLATQPGSLADRLQSLRQLDNEARVRFDQPMAMREATQESARFGQFGPFGDFGQHLREVNTALQAQSAILAAYAAPTPPPSTEAAEAGATSAQIAASLSRHLGPEGEIATLLRTMSATLASMNSSAGRQIAAIQSIAS